MRVISGSARGRKLSAPEGFDTRPTTDRVKESVFNIISPYIPAENVLDMFAGSGAMGIEALSRGCAHAVFLEHTKSAMQTAEKNIEGARLSDRAETVLGDAFSYLGRTNEKFDIIFLDPPYNTGLLSRALEEISRGGRLADGGIVVAECESGGEEPDCGDFETIRRAKYGKTVICILRKVADGGNV